MSQFAQIRAIAHYTVLEARRNRVLWIVALTAFAAVGLAGFVGQVAIVEQKQIEAAFLGAVLRWSAVFIVALVVISGMVREFNDKGFELILSFPIPRSGYLLGKLCGYVFVALLVAACMTLPLLLVVPVSQSALWGLSLGCELILVCGLSLLCMLTLNQTMPAFIVVAAFYVLARSIHSIQLIANGALVDTQTQSQHIVNGVIGAIALFLPGLDQFTATEWLVYHTAAPAALLPVIGQTSVYLMLLIGAGLFDLYRKNL